MENQSPDIADLVIAADARILDKKDNDGYSALHLSVISHNRRLLECLFGHGADPTSIDKEGHNCIHWATGTVVCKHMYITTLVKMNIYLSTISCSSVPTFAENISSFQLYAYHDVAVVG